MADTTGPATWEDVGQRDKSKGKGQKAKVKGSLAGGRGVRTRQGFDARLRHFLLLPFALCLWVRLLSNGAVIT